MPSLYIDGEWVASADGTCDRVINPSDASVVAEVDVATDDQVRAAIAAARRAFDATDWARTPTSGRAALLDRVAGLMDRDLEAMARLETLNTGKAMRESRWDMSDVARVFRYYADLADKDAGRLVDTGNPDAISRIVYEPIGVCALIGPWNYPLLQLSWKIAPALAAGNTFVLKPSELSPSTSILLVQLLEEAGLPPGVANLVLGAGPTAGAPLASHPDVDLLSFTGGLHTGRRLMADAAATVKKVALELGGKNPNVVFADADRETALDFALTAVFLHSGQVCSAGARLIVEESWHDDFVAELAERADAIRLGGPFDKDAETGSLISAAHRDKVEAYVADGLAEGARLACGGRREGDTGYFYRPTILDGCHAGMRVVHEESFGPVLTVETFRTEDEAVRIANDTSYGLAGAVWTQDAGKAQRVAGRLRHGTVWINDYHPYVPQAEWGGFKHSGVGRELGPTGLAEYQEIKHIWQNTRPRPQRWFGAEPGER